MIKRFLKGIGIVVTSASLLSATLLIYTANKQQIEVKKPVDTLPLSNNTASKEDKELQDYEDFLQSVRTPRGFSDIESVNRFALDNEIIASNTGMLEPVKIGELASMLVNLDKYYTLPDGFGDKVKREDADLTKVPTATAYTNDLRTALSRGWLTVEQVTKPDDTISLNDFTRITYNAGLNILHYNKPTEEDIDIALEEVKSVTREDKECRIAKVTFLYYNDLIPFNYKGEFPLERIVTRQDALNMLITFIDVIDLKREDTTNPNAGCEPCADAALALEREQYTNE